MVITFEAKMAQCEAVAMVSQVFESSYEFKRQAKGGRVLNLASDIFERPSSLKDFASNLGKDNLA